MFKKFIVTGVVVSTLALGAVAVAAASSAEFGEGGGPGRGLCRAEVAAAVLETDVETLQAEREAGTDIRQLIEESGVTEEELQAVLENCIETAVAEGEISEERAEAILSGERPERDGERGPRGFGPRGDDTAVE